MSPAEQEHRLAFLGLTAQDEQSLRELKPLLEQHVGDVVERFYEHLLAHDETRQLLRERATVERLKQLQRAYLMRIVEGRFDGDYFADRLRIGRTHERVGLAPQWYLLAYPLYLRLLVPLILAAHAGDARRAGRMIIALEKVFWLDASLAVDAYIASDRFRHLQQLESIVRDSADAIFMLDRDGTIRSWNRAAEVIFGWRAEEILGRPLRTIVPPELLEAGELERIDRELEARGQYHFESTRLAKDGRRIQVEVTASVLRDPQGKVVGRSAIVRDISQRKRLEVAKLQAERLAVVGAMSAKLAHEIRNPLSSIVLNIDLVSDEIEALSRGQAEQAREARSLLRSIDSEVRRIQRVAEEYLQFARLPKPKREWISLAEMLTERLAFIQSLFDAAGVTLRTQFDNGLPLVYADEEQLWQAILNLARNAVEAMPAGGTLTLRLRRDGDGVALTVSDTGKGLTPSEAENLFKPFFSTKPGGTGLGLPLTQQIVAEHGGRIEFESTEGKGTTFVIHLPAAGES